ncbi:28855_t:CDS:2, partial [Racocetra persica]
MLHMSDRQLQIKDINNILEIFMEEYSNSTHKNSINILEKEINKLLELLQTIELDQSVTNSIAYKLISLFQNAQHCFNNRKYLLADCGYQLTSTTIVPYRQPYVNIWNESLNEIEHKSNLNDLNDLIDD